MHEQELDSDTCSSTICGAVLECDRDKVKN